MIEDHFLTYLDQVTTVERKLVFQNAIETLTAAGIAGHEFQIDQMMESDDLGDASDFLLEVEVMLNTTIHLILKQFGVSLDDECPLPMATDILKALLAMDNWSDPASLSSACEAHETSEEILATLLDLTGNHRETDYIVHLAHVTPELIQRIDDVNHVIPENALPTLEERDRAIDRLKAFFAHYNAPILSQAVADLLLIGADYHAMMEHYEEAISSLDMEPAVNELVGFALASDLPNGKGLIHAIEEECQGWWDGHVGHASKIASLIEQRLSTVGVL